MKTGGNNKILLVDDHALIRKGFRALLKDHNPSWEVHEAENGVDAVIKVREIRPDIILMDFIMPKLDGISASENIRREFPDAKIIMVSMDMRPEMIMNMIDAGIMGFVSKDSPDQELITAIREVSNGQSYIGGPASRIALEHIRNNHHRQKRYKRHSRNALFTDREMDILNLLIQGEGSKGTAGKLGISVKTVGRHKENLFRKCQVKSTTDLVRFVLKNNLTNF